MNRRELFGAAIGLALAPAPNAVPWHEFLRQQLAKYQHGIWSRPVDHSALAGLADDDHHIQKAYTYAAMRGPATFAVDFRLRRREAT